MRKAGREYCDMCGKEMDGTDDYYKTIVNVNKHAGGHGEKENMILCTRNKCGRKMFEFIREMKSKGYEQAIKNHEYNIVKEYDKIMKRREENE